MDQSKLFITFSANNKYIEYARCLLNSLRANYPRSRACVRIVNVLEGRTAELKKDFPEVLFIEDVNRHLCSRLKYVKRDASLGRGKMFSEEIAYTCHSRFKNINFLIKNRAKYILSVDADTIFRRNLDDLFNLIKENDIVINDCSGNFTEEGVFGLRVNKLTKRFFNRVKGIVEADLFNWDIDTEAFKVAYSEHKENLKMAMLPKSYKDKSLTKDSHIWSGDGTSKLKENYIKERERYL